MLKVVKVKKDFAVKEAAIPFIEETWKQNSNSSDVYLKENGVKYSEDRLESFFVLIQDDQIIGYCDFIENAPLTDTIEGPWVSSVYMKINDRENNYGQLLINHVLHYAQLQGYSNVYLLANSGDYYREQGWTILENNVKQGSQQILIKELTERC